MKKLIKLIYLIFTAFLFACTNISNKIINRATTINTEITLNGKKVEAEELGFNTDLEKAQEKTKDEEKHLNAKLHTDLLNKDERSKLVLAGRKVNALVEALTEDKGTDKLNVYKAALRAIHIDELRKEREKEFAFVDDKDTEPFDRLLALRELQKELYKKEGYTGELPELNLTDEPNSFAVDGKNGETKKIFISLNDLNNGKASALLYAHENAHLVDYDKGEEIAKYAETKIGENNPKSKFTEKEKAEYKKKLRETIKIDKSLEQQFTEARSIDKNDRENRVELFERDLNIVKNILDYNINLGWIGGHTSISLIPDNQEDFFENGILKEKYKKMGYNEPEIIGDKLGWTVGGFSAEKEKNEEIGKLVVRFNDEVDIETYKKIKNLESNTPLNGKLIAEISKENVSDTKLIENIMEEALRYKGNDNLEKYSILPINLRWYNEELGKECFINLGYNCNSFNNTIRNNFTF